SGDNRTVTFPTSGTLFVLGTPTAAAVFTSNFQNGFVTYMPDRDTAARSDSFTVSDGFMTRTVRIVIQQVPFITTQPTGSTIWTAQPVTSTPAATGDGPIQYRLCEGESGDTSRPVGAPQSSATLSTVLSTTMPFATRQFWIQASNAFGTANTQSVTVTV